MSGETPFWQNMVRHEWSLDDGGTVVLEMRTRKPLPAEFDDDWEAAVETVEGFVDGLDLAPPEAVDG